MGTYAITPRDLCLEREVYLKTRTAAETTSAAVLFYGVPGICPPEDSLTVGAE
jgi:hypothetical protein